MSRPFRAAALLALMPATLALAACGSSSNGGAQALLKQTFTSHNQKVTSGKIAMAVDIAGGFKNLKQPVSLKLSGPFQSAGPKQLPKFDFSLAIGGNGQSINVGATTTGDKAFVAFAGTSYAVPDTLFQGFKQGYAQAQATSQSQSKSNTSALQNLIHPLSWLKDAKVAGDATIGGAPTKHVSASIDVAKFLDDVGTLLKKAPSLAAVPGAARVPQQLTPQQKASAEKAIKHATFDVYTGTSDHILRKLDVNLQVAQSGQTGNVKLSIEIDGLNTPQTISAPANPQPASALQSKLQSLGGLLGGSAAGGGAAGGAAGGGAAGGSPGGSSSGAATAQKAQAYAQCITAAGSDVTKAQKCADLLK